MAARRKPSFVNKLGKDGRRLFSKEFKDAVVNDILSGRAKQAELERKYKLGHSMVCGWLKNARTFRPVANVPSSAPQSRDLLKRAREAEASRRENTAPSQIDRMIDQHVKLAQAFIAGDITDVGVKFALDKPRDRKFMVTVWLGQVLAGAFRCGYKLVKP